MDRDWARGLAVPPPSEVKAWAQNRRAFFAARAAARPPVRPGNVTVEEHQVPGATRGQPAVHVRIYRRQSTTGGPQPALVWFYGGMFMIGALADNDAYYTGLAQQLDAVIVGVEYRKAPEDPFPAALDDCYEALSWFTASAAGLGIDPSRIAVGGASAGGNLAAAVSLIARDRGGPRIAFQVPLNAALDDRVATPSAREITDERMANHDIMVRVWDEYLGPMRKREVSPYAAPTRAAQLEGLPPAYMYVGGLDPMRDENIQYASRLMQAGIPTELHVYPGAFHQFAVMAPTTTISRRAHEDLVASLKRAFARHASAGA